MQLMVPQIKAWWWGKNGCMETGISCVIKRTISFSLRNLHQALSLGEFRPSSWWPMQEGWVTATKCGWSQIFTYSVCGVRNWLLSLALVWLDTVPFSIYFISDHLPAKKILSRHFTRSVTRLYWRWIGQHRAHVPNTNCISQLHSR